jgi:hypothetical protein
MEIFFVLVKIFRYCMKNVWHVRKADAVGLYILDIAHTYGTYGRQMRWV